MAKKKPKKFKQKTTEELIQELREYHRRWNKIEKDQTIEKSGSIKFIRKDLK